MNQQRLPGKLGGQRTTMPGCRLWAPAIADRSAPAALADPSPDGASTGLASALAPAAACGTGWQGADPEPQPAGGAAPGAAG